MSEKQEDNNIQGGDKAQATDRSPADGNVQVDPNVATPTTADQGRQSEEDSGSQGTAATDGKRQVFTGKARANTVIDTAVGYGEEGFRVLEDIALNLKASILMMKEEALNMKQDAINAQEEALNMNRECLQQWENLLHQAQAIQANIALLASARDKALDAREASIEAQERVINLMTRNIERLDIEGLDIDLSDLELSDTELPDIELSG
ncbi:hypothetical protein F5Y10DRAFT_238222 [Nemania abortiva]|nr:hypothetical protein F5Y10DRAFT_238222 [Nemania abortiva]